MSADTARIPETALAMHSTLTSEGMLKLSLDEIPVPEPGPNEVDFAKHMVDGQAVQAGGPRADGMHGAGGYSYPGEGQNDNRGLAKDHHVEEEDDMMEDVVEDVEDVEDDVMDDDMAADE